MLARRKSALRRQSTGTWPVANGRHECHALCCTLEDFIVWDLQADYNAMQPLGYSRKFTIKRVRKYLLGFWKGEE